MQKKILTSMQYEEIISWRQVKGKHLLKRLTMSDKARNK